MHPRKALRLAFKERLLNNTGCADRVYSTMTPPIEIEDTLKNEGPVMMVYLRHEEEREEDYPAGREDGAFRRRPELTIEVLAVSKPGESVDDTLDDIAEEIESLIEDWSIPGFPSVDPLLMATQIDVADTGDRITGGLFMQYHMKVWSPYRSDGGAYRVPDVVSAVPQAPQPPAPAGTARDVLIDTPDGWT